MNGVRQTLSDKRILYTLGKTRKEKEKSRARCEWGMCNGGLGTNNFPMARRAPLVVCTRNASRDNFPDVNR